MDATSMREVGPDVRPRFHGSAGAMYPVVMKGLAFTVLTLGVYRFWYMTAVRRFLWTNVEIDGDGLEYTGRGVELLIGFLIALAIVAPFNGLVLLATLQLNPVRQGALEILATLALLFLAQYALFRARRYRLTRTVWRGIRLQQSGSGFAYATRSFFWALASLVTLGLAYPWMRASLERYKMEHTWYGDQKGAFDGAGGRLFRRGALLWLILALGLVAVGYGAYAARDVISGPIGGQAAIVYSLPLAALLLVFVGMIPLYLAIEFRWWAEGCRVGPASARCDLGLFAFFKVYLGYLGIVLLFIIGLSVLGALLSGVGWLLGLGQPGAEVGPLQIAAAVFGVILYFVIALSFAALWQLFCVRPIWRKSFESVTIVGLGALVAAQSSAPEANAFGEGVADALDFGGF